MATAGASVGYIACCASGGIPGAGFPHAPRGAAGQEDTDGQRLIHIDGQHNAANGFPSPVTLS